jgi:hypothetical protein
MYTGPNINPTGLVFAMDASSLRSISGTGNQSYNGAPSVVKNIVNRGEAVTSYNGVRLTNVNYYTAFAIDYPENVYGGSAANRDGITPGFNVTAGSKVFDYGRALNYAVFDNNTQTFVKTTVYDSYVGTAAVDAFVSEYYQMVAQYPNATHIVAGSHRDSYHTEAQYTILRDLGAPSNVNNIIGFSSPEWILVGEPGLGAGNAYGWAFQNYSTNPDQVAHLVFPLPLKGNKNSGFLFDGTNTYIDVPTSVFPAMSQMTIELINYGIDARNSSIIAGGIGGNQDLNIHLPWGDGNIYWDAGRPFNRVYKAAGSDYIGYHHWVFTKNSSTGIMNIYRDGALWAQNTGQTSSIISLSGGQASIGRYSNGSTNAYHHNGIVPVLKIYNVELSALQVDQNFQSYRSRFGI